MLAGVSDNLAKYAQLRSVDLPNSALPAIRFDPQTPAPIPASPRRPVSVRPHKLPPLPDDLEDLAFWPVTHLSTLVRTRQVTSRQLTEMYLARLKRIGPRLECVVTLIEEPALEQARRADEEIAQGIYRGPLHGIPWGAKDLLATKGIKTTWGATPYKDQVIDMNATVVERLEAAGAVLVAKLTMGALAWGDVWFGGKARSPWNTEEGSERLVGGFGRGDRCGAGWLCYRNGNVRLHRVALDGVRRERAAPHFRPRQPPRGDGALLDAGQDRADVPFGGGLRAGVRCDPRAGRL